MMCHRSKNLYNQKNYILRQEFMKKETLTGYSDLVKLFQRPFNNKENNNYQKLQTQTAQWTVKKVKQAWNSFFKAFREYRKHKDNFTGKPEIPKYKVKNGEFMLIFTNWQCRIDNEVLNFPKIMKLDVKTGLDNVDLREVRIIPQDIGYVIEIVDKNEIEDISS